MVEAGQSRLQPNVVQTIQIVDEIQTRPLADNADVRRPQSDGGSVIQLRDVVAEEAHLTGTGAHLGGERGDQRRLARTTWPADHDPFLPVDTKAETAQGGDIMGAAAVQDEGVVDLDDGVVRRLEPHGHVVPRIRSSSGTRRAESEPAIALTPRINNNATERPATASHGTSRRSGGFGRPDVADTATKRVAICSSQRPAIKPSGSAMHTAAIAFPATIATSRRPSTRSSASVRSSGRSSAAAAAAPNHSAHAPSTIATMAEAARINSVATASGSVASAVCRVERRSTRSLLNVGSDRRWRSARSC